MKSMALISTPWPMFNRPSIQMGALKAYLKRERPELKIASHHVYLPVAAELGYEIYESICQSTWLAEPLYGALLYPEMRKRIEAYWNRMGADFLERNDLEFSRLTKRLEHISLSIIDGHDWGEYGLLGFSVSLSQLSSSLYFLREIKKRAPSVRIAAGGASCAGPMGEALLANFEELDYVIDGEGEIPLLGLVKFLEARPATGPSASGGSQPAEFKTKRVQILKMDDLPFPDYDDYFRTLESLSPDSRFIPKIPLEVSRGCWWKSSASGGCRFCNLNLLWDGYRTKSVDRVIREVKAFTARHKCLSVSFVDNLMPSKGLETLFSGLKGLGKDLSMFCELRAETPGGVLHEMGRAGMKEIQVGIESLSSALLGKLNKGTRVIDNIEIMKNCEQDGYPDLVGNLIMSFPSSDERDVKETLESLDFVSPFRPLKAIDFWLGYGSPVWERPSLFGIRRRGNHSSYSYVFPEDEFKRLQLIMQAYSGGIRRLRKLWAPVRKKVKGWKRLYNALHEGAVNEPILCYRDGGSFLLIHQRNMGSSGMTHRLTGKSRQIYLFCRGQQSLDRIAGNFPSLSRAAIEDFLSMMTEKRLVFRDGDRFISLAIPASRFSVDRY